jgi:hypothetical protein
LEETVLKYFGGSERFSVENVVDKFDELFDDDVVQLHLRDDRFRASLLCDAVNLRVSFKWVKMWLPLSAGRKF